MAGHMGDYRVSIKNLVIAQIDAENNLLYLSGPVPCARNAIVKIVRSSYAKKA